MERPDLPPLVLERALSNGAAGRRWLDALPTVVAELCEQWGVDVGATCAGGTAGYVAEATDRAGRACVLKVAMPLDIDEERTFARSVLAHRLADGLGCAELWEVDEGRHALLLERLGPNLAQLGLDVDGIIDAVTGALRAFWRPVDDPSGLQSGPDKAAWLADYVDASWRDLGRPCERGVIDRAIECCERRAAGFDPTRAVLVHGDGHGWNTVRAGDGWKLVDPEGLWSEPEHDLAVLMREYNGPLLQGDTPTLVRARAELLASRCGVDAQAVWEWGYVERVSTGLANLHDFDGDAGRAFLEVARRCT